MKCNAYILADQLRRRGYQVATIIHNPDPACNMFEEIKPYSATKENSGVAIYMDRHYGRSLYGYQNKELPLTILCFCSRDPNEDLDDNWSWIFASSSKDQKKKQADLESVQRELAQWQDDIAQSVDNPAEFKQFAERIAKYQRNPVIVTDPAYALVSCGGSIPAPEYIDDPLLAALFECNNEGFRLMEEPLSRSLKKRFEEENGNSNECEHRMFAITDSDGNEFGQVLIPEMNGSIDDAENSYFIVAMEAVRGPGVLRKLKYSYRSLLKTILVDGMATSGIQGHLLESFAYCFGWKQGELYRLILVASRENSRIDAAVVRLAMIGIKETLPSCDVFTDRQGKMIILDRIDESDRSPADMAAIDAGLMKLCRDHNLRMASSMQYDDYKHLHLAYLQAAQAIDAPANGQPIVYFHEMSPYLMVRKLGQTGRPEWFCHPAVLRLNDDADPEHRLLDTLFAYLMRGSNESATAEALGVTRVTVSKRIAKLTVLLDLDLDALSDHERLHLALSCSIIKNNSKNNQEEDYGRRYDD